MIDTIIAIVITGAVLVALFGTFGKGLGSIILFTCVISYLVWHRIKHGYWQ